MHLKKEKKREKKKQETIQKIRIKKSSQRQFEAIQRTMKTNAVFSRWLAGALLGVSEGCISCDHTNVYEAKNEDWRLINETQPLVSPKSVHIRRFVLFERRLSTGKKKKKNNYPLLACVAFSNYSSSYYPDFWSNLKKRLENLGRFVNLQRMRSGDL